MFTYNELKIVSAVPVARIREYMDEIGANELAAGEKHGLVYKYNDLEIEITACSDVAFPEFGISKHIISVTGGKTPAEEFLTAFRYRFLSVGG